MLFLFVLIYIGLFIWGVVLAKRYGWFVWSNLALLVILALIYDNGLLAIGRYIGEGELLESLNVVRYYLHALFTPLLVLVAYAMLTCVDITWMRSKWVMFVAILLTIGLIIYELVTQVLGITLEATWQYGILSYDNTSANEIPFMVITVSAILLITSAVLWWKQGWKWLFIGIVLMTIGSAIPLPIESIAISNAFELILIFSIILTIAFQRRLS